MLEPDTVSLHQYLDSWRGSGALEPEKRLLLAILQDAVELFQKYAFPQSRKAESLFRETQSWFFENDSEWPCSFVSICEVFGFSPDYLRRGLLRWKARALRERSRCEDKQPRLMAQNG